MATIAADLGFCTPYTVEVFKQAAATAAERSHPSVGTEHIVHALVVINGPALHWVAELAGASQA